MKKNTAPKTAEDSFIQEINESVKNDNIKQILDKYGLFILLFVVAAIVAAVSFESIKSWRMKQHFDSSNVYAYAINLKAQGKFDESIKILEELKENSSNIYSDISQMQIANNLIEAGKTQEAVVELEKIAADKDIHPQIHDAAVIKLASFKLENAPKEEIEALLKPLTAENGNWAPIANEMLAMLAIRDKDFAAAKNLYGEIANDANASDSLKSRAQDMISILDENAK